MTVTFNEKQYLKDLQSLIAYDTSRLPADGDAPFGKPTLAALRAFLKLAQGYGFKTKNVDNYCGYVEYGSGEKMIALLSHLDVVPAGDPATWKTPPFTLTVKDDTMYGRGTVDDKGPLVLALHVLKALKDSNLPLHKRVRLIVGCGEETGSECMQHYTKVEELPQYAITPDADYPGIIGEKGVLRLRFFKKLSGQEPVIVMKVGTVINAVPGEAEATVNGKRYEAIGRAAHGAMPEKGDNALLKLCRNLSKEYQHDFLKLMQLMTKTGLNIDVRDEYSVLTLAPSLATVDATTAEAKCDIRFPVTMHAADILARIKAAVAPTGFTVEIIRASEPLNIAPDSAFAQGLLATYQKCTGDTKSRQSIIGGGTYAKFLPNTMAFGILFPGEEATEHMANECWSLKSVRKNFPILVEAVKTLDNL
jgi:succinyl-diaminopimelate desuccinylase